MKCQKCNKNEANVQYRETVNGVTREISLCSHCAKETGLLDRTSGMFEKMERQLLGAFSSPFGGLGRSSFAPLGLSGSIFSEPFSEVGGFFENDPVESMKILSVPEKPKADEEQPETVDSLKAKLLDAIADERYEDAAKYRDKIKQLKGE